jgi:drug/metabolite transporter (DMT)-like permease
MRKIAHGDALFLAGIKGLIAGIVNLLIALWWLGASLPHFTITAIILVGGFFSYGLSLMLFIIALRHLGTSRTGAYFSVAPFIGALLAILFLGESASWLFWCALCLMALGVWLHLTENHEHIHTHEELWHKHNFPHDSAHEIKTEHDKLHHHPQLEHSHAHYPDSEHLHRHD